MGQSVLWGVWCARPTVWGGGHDRGGNASSSLAMGMGQPKLGFGEARKSQAPTSLFDRRAAGSVVVRWGGRTEGHCSKSLSTHHPAAGGSVGTKAGSRCAESPSNDPHLSSPHTITWRRRINRHATHGIIAPVRYRSSSACPYSLLHPCFTPSLFHARTRSPPIARLPSTPPSHTNVHSTPHTSLPHFSLRLPSLLPPSSLSPSLPHTHR